MAIPTVRGYSMDSEMRDGERLVAHTARRTSPTDELFVLWDRVCGFRIYSGIRVIPEGCRRAAETPLCAG